MSNVRNSYQFVLAPPKMMARSPVLHHQLFGSMKCLLQSQLRTRQSVNGYVRRAFSQPANVQRFVAAYLLIANRRSGRVPAID
jgi:hypothetical protein